MKNGNIYAWEPESERGYSIGWNLNTIIEKGLHNREPPTSSHQLLEQTIELTQKSSTEWGGPITFNSLDNYLVTFLEEEKPSKLDFIEEIETFFNKLSKHQVTISLDLIPRPEFDPRDNTQKILDAINDVFKQIYRAQLNQGIFSPQIVINLYPETSWDLDSLNGWLELSYFYGAPSYQNFKTGTIAPESLRPRGHIPDPEVTYLRLGGVNANSENQCVTGYTCINLEKLASEAESEEQFFQLVMSQLNQTVDILQVKKKLLMSRFDGGEMPLTDHFIDDFNWGYSVITLVGMNEALETLVNASMGHVVGKAITYKLLEQLLREMEFLQGKTGLLLSLESYPSQNLGAELLNEYDSEYEYLTAATELKPDHGDDLWDVLEHQKKYHSLYTGGTLQQSYLETGLEYHEGLNLLLERIIKTFGYNYLAITPIFSLCAEHGYVKSDNNCPICGEETETYTRIDHEIVKISELPTQLKEAYWKRVYYDVKNK